MLGRKGPAVALRAVLRRRSVRWRSVAASVVVVTVALLAGGGGLVYLLQINLERTVRAATQTRAEEVVSLIQQEGVIDAVSAIRSEARSGQLVQILTEDGVMVGASSRLAASAPMAPSRPAPGRTTTTVEDLDHVGTGGDWVVASRGVATATGKYVVQVASPITVQRQTVQMVAVFLLAVSPLLVAGAGFAVWVLVGRALQPVERIRAEVDAVDDRHLDRRVDVPVSGDEIAALAETMNGMLARLEDAQRSQRAFVSDASHELRSPLATLTAAADLAVEADEPTRTRLLGTISAELARLRMLVEGLMTLARADAHDLSASFGEVDLDDIVDAEVRRVRATSELDVVVDLEPLRVSGDAPRLTQAVRNVIDNAVRHARSTVWVELSRSPDGEAVVRIDNDGPPIAASDRERVFDRFVRLDASRSRDAGGSGLGLSIARAAVQEHDGRIEVVEGPSGRCRFQIVLPVEGDTAGRSEVGLGAAGTH
jgi:signal transduction histidine kinase